MQLLDGAVKVLILLLDVRVTDGVRATGPNTPCAVPAAYIHGSLLLLLGSLVYIVVWSCCCCLFVVVYPGSLGIG